MSYLQVQFVSSVDCSVNMIVLLPSVFIWVLIRASHASVALWCSRVIFPLPNAFKTRYSFPSPPDRLFALAKVGLVLHPVFVELVKVGIGL